MGGESPLTSEAVSRQREIERVDMMCRYLGYAHCSPDEYREKLEAEYRALCARFLVQAGPTSASFGPVAAVP